MTWLWTRSEPPTAFPLLGHWCTVGVLPRPTSVPSDVQAGWHCGQIANSCVLVCLCVVCCVALDHVTPSVDACRPGTSDRSCRFISTMLSTHASCRCTPSIDFCSCIRGSVFCTAHVSHLLVLMRLIARVSSWRCYPRTVSVLLLNTVAWRCFPRSTSQPSSFLSSKSWHLALGACCLLGCSRRPDRDTSASSVSWKAAL